MKKKQKCKVCKKGVKQKAGPGRPKTMHDRCKKKSTKKKTKKTKKTNKKKAPKNKKAGLLQIQKCPSCKNWTQGKHHCWNCGKNMPSKVQSKGVTLAAYMQIQRDQERVHKKSRRSPLDDYYSLGRRKNPFRRNARIGGYRPGGDPRPSESKHCEHIVTNVKTGITKPCGKVTREGKPYCPKHVKESTYVQDLMERLAGKSYEESIAAAGLEKLEEHLETHQVDVTLTMEEILLVLKLHGGRSIERLARDINVSKETAKTYVGLLEKRGKVITGKSRRGATVVELPKKRRLRRRNPWSPESKPDWRGTGGGELFDVPRLFVFNGVSVSTDMLLDELYNMEKDQQAIIIYNGARYRISGYGPEKGNIKIVLDNIIKFSPESLIKFILSYEKR